MRFFKVMAAQLAIVLLTLTGCGGGGGSTSASVNDAPAPAGDQTAPFVFISAPANGSTAGGTVVLAANVSDNVGVTRVEFYLDGSIKGSVSSAPYVFNWDTAPLAAGNHTWAAKAFDAAGNIGQSGNVVVTLPTVPTVPVTVSMSTVISGNSAVGTVFLAGLTVPDAFGLELTVSMPAGASIASVTKSGVAMVASTTEANGQTVILAGNTGFGSGEVMRVNFVDVPAGDMTAGFGIAQSIAFGAGGVPIP